MIAGLLVLVVCGGLFTTRYRLLWRRHGVYPVGQGMALASGHSELFLIDRRHQATFRLSRFGRLIGPLGVWPRGAIRGVALDDRVKIEDDRWGYKFVDRRVTVSLPGAGTTTDTIEFSTDW